VWGATICRWPFTRGVFRQHGVRFIAESNGIDSAKGETNEFAPFFNIMRNVRQRQQPQAESHLAEQGP
jgi:hypothetical protein